MTILVSAAPPNILSNDVARRSLRWQKPFGSPALATLQTAEIVSANNTIEFEVTLSNTKTNIGGLTGSELYHAIYTALAYLCPQEGHKCRTEEYSINYRNQSRPLKVKIKNSLYADENSVRKDSLRRLMIGTIAGVAEAQSKTANNCFQTNSTSWCNIGDQVHAHINNKERYIEAAFHTDNHDGAYNCETTMGAAVGKVDPLLPELISVYATNNTGKPLFLQRELQCRDFCGAY